MIPEVNENYIFTVIAACAVVGLVYFAHTFRKRKARAVSDGDTVVIVQFPRGPHGPSVSPFPIKLETFLRMAKIPYKNEYSGQMSSKGKIPWMKYKGSTVADSQFCIDFLKREKKINLDSHLTESERAVARSFLKLTEENLYWTMCYETFVRGGVKVLAQVMPYRGLKLWIYGWIITYMIKKEMWGHGIGRHSDEEIWNIAKDDLRAISNFLGDKPFFMGSQPSEIDCAMFGMLVQVICHMPSSRHEKFVQDELPNITKYCERMKEKFWPDWNKCSINHKDYEEDHGKIYCF